MGTASNLTGQQRDRGENRLLRGDAMPYSDSLPRRIGLQLRNAYPAPETREDAFQSLLQKIEAQLP